MDLLLKYQVGQPIRPVGHLGLQNIFALCSSSNKGYWFCNPVQSLSKVTLRRPYSEKTSRERPFEFCRVFFVESWKDFSATAFIFFTLNLQFLWFSGTQCIQEYQKAYLALGKRIKKNLEKLSIWSKIY